MSYLFACSQCGREMKTDERHVGRKVRCPGCETLLGDFYLLEALHCLDRKGLPC